MKAERLTMKIVSVNVGLPRDVEHKGERVRTSIWKRPVEGPVRVRRLNLEGDRQSDLSVHGGPDKAVYVYPSEHYAFWRAELPGMDLPWGSFGENLTTQGLLEESVSVGDRIRAGSAEFVVTQPRLPCFKLGIRFDRRDMVKRFLRSRRTGFYLSVLNEGQLAAGDAISHARSEERTVTIEEFVSLYGEEAGDLDILRRVIGLAALPEGWKEYFRKRLLEQDS